MRHNSGTMRHYEAQFSFFVFLENFKNTFEIFQCIRKVAPSFFLIFCNKLDFQKAQRVHTSTILKTLRFLSLGYGADFRRSRLFFFRQITELTLYVLFVHYALLP